MPPARTRSGGETTDHHLVRAVRAGDDRAFEELYARYHRRIAAYVHGMVHDHGRTEDITQEVFMSALRRMRETDRQIAFKPWVYEIAKNACIDAFRRSRRAEEVSYDADDGLGDHDARLMHAGPTPDVAVDQKMSLDHLRGAFGGLSEAHHEILVMRELEGLSYREIGERLGMSRPSVESTLFRARRRLTEEYEELVSGERCRRIQAIIAERAGGRLGARDERRMARHVSYCQPCRRHAFMAGFDVAALSTKPVRAKVAGLLPLPAFLKRRWLGGHEDRVMSPAAGHGTAVAQLSGVVGQYAEPMMSSWAKAAAVASAFAVAGVGAGVATHDGGGGGAHRARDRAPAAQPARAGAAPARSASSQRAATPVAAGAVKPHASSRGSTPQAAGSSSAGSGAAGSQAGAGPTPTVAPPAISTPSTATATTKTSPVLDKVNKALDPAREPTGRPAPSTGTSTPNLLDAPKTVTTALPSLPVPDPTKAVSGVTGGSTDSGSSGGGTLGGVTDTVCNLVGGG